MAFYDIGLSTNIVLAVTKTVSDAFHVLNQNEILCVCISGSEISTDDRSYLMHLINSMDVQTSNVFFYPKLLPMVSLTAN